VPRARWAGHIRWSLRDAQELWREGTKPRREVQEESHKYLTRPKLDQRLDGRYPSVTILRMLPIAGLEKPLRHRVDAFAHNVAALEDDDVDGLHGARVASRRLRELLPLLGLEASRQRKLSRRLKAVTKALGIVRELDVQLLLIDELTTARRYPEDALEQLRGSVKRARAEHRQRLWAQLSPEKFRRLAKELTRLTAKSSRAHRAALEARLVGRATRLRSAIESAGTAYDTERLHAVRVALKKFRYVYELSSPSLSTELNILKSVQDTLGRLHDLQVLIDWCRTLQSSFGPGELAAWHHLGNVARTVEDECRRLHASYMRERTQLLSIIRRMQGSSVSAVWQRQAAS